MSDQKFDYTGREELEQAKLLPRYNLNIARQLMKVIGPQSHIMDFGAGEGTISELIRAHSEAKKLITLDIDEENQTVLKSKEFDVLASLDQCEDNSLDVIYSSDVLEHIEDDLEILKALYQKLKPGGYMAHWVPAHEILWTSMDDRVAHFRRYTRSSMIKVFKEAGFEIERCYYQDCLGFPIVLLSKLIGDKGRNDNNLKIYDQIIFPVSHCLDFIFKYLIGKNLVMHAKKP